jgi:hypothetical protein
MLLFRSEEHVDAWTEMGNPRGESMSVEQQWALAKSWFQGRHLPSWQRRTAAEAQAVLRSVGLVSDFWSFD